MPIIVIIIYFIICIYYLYRNRKRWCSPVYFFILSQIIMFIGILYNSDYSYKSDIKHIYIYFMALIFYLIGVYFAKIVKINNSSNYDDFPIDRLSSLQEIYLISIIFIGVIVCTYYFSRGEGNVFLLEIISLISGRASSMVEIRRGLSNVSGVGYIMQFRGVLLPLVTIYLVFFRKGDRLYKIGLLMFPLTIAFLLGTGQRGQFMLIGIIVFCYLFQSKKQFNDIVPIRKLFILITVIISLFGILSIANNHIKQTHNNSIIIGVFKALIERIFIVNQECAVLAFRYVDSIPTVWGYDWLMMFSDLLPGRSSYTSLDVTVYSLMYHSPYGTAPPDIWTSAWYNFNIFGVTIFPFLLGIFYERTYKNYILRRKTRMTTLIYTFKVIIMGLWIGGSPMALLNHGLLTIYIFQIFHNIFDCKKGRLQGSMLSPMDRTTTETE